MKMHSRTANCFSSTSYIHGRSPEAGSDVVNNRQLTQDMKKDEKFAEGGIYLRWHNQGLWWLK